MCGTHIRKASETARRMAVTNCLPVRFKFNDVVLTATRKTSVASLLWTFDLVTSQHAQSYRKSKRGIEAARRRKQQIADKQQAVDHLINTLEASIANGLSDVVLWLSRFSEVADDVDVAYSEEIIIQALKSAGYVADQHVGRPKEDFTNKQLLGEYIVGQAISCLEGGMPPHPITQTFAATFFKL